ncbi:MAG: thioredoxin domain-containing protein [Bdellovibrio sp.]
MKFTFLIPTSALFLMACTPSPKQLKEAIEKDPSIVFSAIEKDPKGFFESIEKAQKNAQNQMAEDQWKNPLKPEIDEARVFEGNKSGKITIVEYADFLCGYCQQGHFTMKEVVKKYPDQVRILFKNKPILHPVSRIAARHYVALSLTNPEGALKFKDLAFTNQGKIKEAIKKDSGKGSEKFPTAEKLLADYIKQAGGDPAQLKAQLEKPDVDFQIAKDEKESDEFQFSGTPGYIVNGVPVRGAGSLETFAGIIDRHLKSLQ